MITYLQVELEAEPRGYCDSLRIRIPNRTIKIVFVQGKQVSLVLFEKIVA